MYTLKAEVVGLSIYYLLSISYLYMCLYMYMYQYLFFHSRLIFVVVARTCLYKFLKPFVFKLVIYAL